MAKNQKPLDKEKRKYNTDADYPAALERWIRPPELQFSCRTINTPSMTILDSILKFHLHFQLKLDIPQFIVPKDN